MPIDIRLLSTYVGFIWIIRFFISFYSLFCYVCCSFHSFYVMCFRHLILNITYMYDG